MAGEYYDPNTGQIWYDDGQGNQWYVRESNPWEQPGYTEAPPAQAYPSPIDAGGDYPQDFGQPGKAIVRSYPEQRPDGSTWEVDEWSDGSYTDRMVSGPAGGAGGASVQPGSFSGGGAGGGGAGGGGVAAFGGARGAAGGSPSPAGVDPRIYAQRVAEAQIAYYVKMLEELQKPQMEINDRNTRHQMALSAAVQYTQQMGFAITPDQIMASLSGGGLPTGPTPTQAARDFERTHALAQQAQDFEQQAEITRRWASPRDFVSGLLIGGVPPPGGTAAAAGPTQQGLQPAQAAQFLQNTPFYRGLVGQSPTTTRPGSEFAFIGGHQLPVRETISDLQYDPERTAFTAGLADFSGQDPESFYGAFGRALPKGERAPLTRFR